MSLATEKLAKLLRTHESVLVDFEEQMNAETGKSGVLTEVAEDIERRVNEALGDLNVPQDPDTNTVFEALIKKIKENDKALLQYLGNPSCATEDGCRTIIALAKEITGVPKGFFVKKELAERLLRKNPPQRLMKKMEIGDVDTLLKKFPLEVVFPAIRFAEDSRWLNEVFFRPYEMITPADFEEREVEVVVLPPEFIEIGRHFAGAKLHHISHLKELGTIFVMPIEKQDGAALEVLTLVLHYLQEVPFYSRIFQRFAKEPESFSGHLVSALRGDVLPALPADEKDDSFLIVQRYLAKNDPVDPRLLAPHVNPEATHWRLVEDKLTEWGAKEHPEFNFQFWQDLGPTGDFFQLSESDTQYHEHGVSDEVLVSFDFIDNLFAHNREASALEKYLYHQQEALWNELFAAYLGREEAEQLVEDSLEQGFIRLGTA